MVKKEEEDEEEDRVPPKINSLVLGNENQKPNPLLFWSSMAGNGFQPYSGFIVPMSPPWCFPSIFWWSSLLLYTLSPIIILLMISSSVIFLSLSYREAILINDWQSIFSSPKTDSKSFVLIHFILTLQVISPLFFKVFSSSLPQRLETPSPFCIFVARTLRVSLYVFFIYFKSCFSSWMREAFIDLSHEDIKIYVDSLTRKMCENTWKWNWKSFSTLL